MSERCPLCHTELDTVQFLLQAREVFSEVGHKVKFSCCGAVFYIESDKTPKWYETLKDKPRTKSGHCGGCGKSLQGSKFKFYCNGACKQKAYRQRKSVTLRA